MAKEKVDEMLKAGPVEDELVVTVEASVADAPKAPEVEKKVVAKEPAPPKAELTVAVLKDALSFLAFKTLEPSEFKEFKMRLGE